LIKFVDVVVVVVVVHTIVYDFYILDNKCVVSVNLIFAVAVAAVVVVVLEGVIF
jgi:hypothetical protein